MCEKLNASSNTLCWRHTYYTKMKCLLGGRKQAIALRKKMSNRIIFSKSHTPSLIHLNKSTNQTTFSSSSVARCPLNMPLLIKNQGLALEKMGIPVTRSSFDKH